MVFSNSSTNLGILERVRNMARVDANQWPTPRVVASANDRLDKIMAYGKRIAKGFPLDDSNHTKIPIGTETMTSGTHSYSFLTDQQSNRITNILRVDLLDANGTYRKLKAINLSDISGAVDEYQSTAGTPTEYLKISDNVIRLFPTPDATVAAAIKYWFQRAPSYFTASDTTKEPGFARELDRGFVIQGAYDAALTLGLANLNNLAVELQREDKVMEDYFSSRESDKASGFKTRNESCR